MRQFLFLTLVTFISTSLFAQFKPKLQKAENKTSVEQLAPVKPIRPNVPLADPPFSQKNYFNPISNLPAPIKDFPSLQVYLSPELNTPKLIKGNFKTDAEKSTEKNIDDYLNVIQPYLKIKNPTTELAILKKDRSIENAFEHWHFQQKWNGIPVYGAEAKIHLKENEIYLFHGHIYPTPELNDVTPFISKEIAGELAMEAVSDFTNIIELSAAEKKLISGEQINAELVIYHLNKKINTERLVWHVTVIPNLTHKYSYFIDAKTGDILKYYSELCQIAGHHFINKNENKKSPQPFCSENHADHNWRSQSEFGAGSDELLNGPDSAFAVDLCGITRKVHTYEVGNDYFLIDASRPMFNFSQSNMPGEPVGAIWTIDGQNNSPQNNDFQAAHVVSFNNSWNNAIAVSAHYHGGLAYEYFRNKFGRESINGQGGTIISLINITDEDGDDMDNAFWNGAAMFYGNGKVAFDEPLAKSPDVAGHEMTHGVVQATANLEYFGESGALNESFADVFGAMIDPDRDFQIGEDIANNSVFPTGAMRDMANPHNGGSNLNHNGYQPAHYDERYTGNQDNGGVHINSGIPNKAFHLFAQAIGKDKAEQVYYRALVTYLFRSAQFIDCRIAVVQAATDLYGTTEANAAKDAFAAVGIGEGSGTNSQTNSDTNPGDEFVLMSDSDYSNLYIFTPNGTEIFNPLTNVSPLSRPSVTDDGSAIVYIATDNTMRAITIDWQTNNDTSFVLQGNPIWRNVAISKDARHLAALTTDNDNSLLIYDFDLAVWDTFYLFNPTTGQNGPTTGDVQYADVLEWDITGEWVMYDALNRINTTGNAEIEYWDISFTHVWNNDFNNFSDGYTSKLFNGLPEDVSVGNPTFSKNSDYIIAFDYIDGFNNEYSLRAANIETGDVGTIFNNGGGLSWPNYSIDDGHIVFDANDNSGTPVLAFIPIASDKISASDYAFVFIENGRWGVWFANGERELVNADELFAEDDISIFPNPVKNKLTLQWSSDLAGEASVEIFDLLGKKIKTESFNVLIGDMQQTINMSELPSGNYFVQLLFNGNRKAFKIVKN